MRPLAPALSALMTIMLCCSAAAQPVLDSKVYVAHPLYYEDGHSAVSVFNLSTRTRVAVIYSAAPVDRILAAPDGARLYLFSSTAGKCVVYDPVIDQPVLEFNTGGAVADVSFTADGKRLLVSHGGLSGDDNSVTILAADSGTEDYTVRVGRTPTALAASRDGAKLYVVDHDAGVIQIIDLKSYQLVGTVYAGVNPVDLGLSDDGRYLMVTAAGLSNGLGGGLAVIDTRTDRVVGLAATQGALSSLAVLLGNRVVALERDSSRCTLDLYEIAPSEKVAGVQLVAQIPVGGTAAVIASTPDRKLIVYGDQENGEIRLVDPTSYQTVAVLGDAIYKRSGDLAAVPIDFARQLAIRDSLLKIDPQSNMAQDAYFQKAYIFRSRGDKNSEVAVYNELAARYPGSRTEVGALLRLGDLCYGDMLFANAADFYTRALKAYATYLGATVDAQPVEDQALFSALDRLGDYCVTNDKGNLKDAFAAFEKLTIFSPQLAQANFQIGYYLKRQGDVRVAKRALDESERQLIHLSDPQAAKKLRDKIGLLSNDPRVMLVAEKVKEGPLVDGDLADWKGEHSLALNTREDVAVGYARWADETDLSGRFSASFDKNNLYLSGDIADNVVFAAGDLKRDRVIIYLDLRVNSGDYLFRQKDVDANVVRLEILPPTSPDQAFAFKHPADIQPICSGKLRQGGYQFEIKLPFVYFRGFDPEKNQRIGLGLELWDADSDLASDPLRIMGWLLPTETVEGDRDCRMFGVLVFRP